MQMAVERADVDDSFRDNRGRHDRSARLKSPFDAAELLWSSALVDAGAGDITVKGILCECSSGKKEQTEEYVSIHPGSPGLLR